MSRRSRIVSAALSLLLMPVVAGAQVRFVRASAPAGGDGQSWGTAFRDLQIALAAAQVNPSITQLWVAEGTYRPGAIGNRAATFALRSGLALFGGFAGNETALDQRSPGLHPTTLDGDLTGDDLPGFVNFGDNSQHVVTASGVDSTAVLDGFTVRGGSTSPGAGISCLRATPSLRNLSVRENHGLGNNNEGGGLFVRLDAGQVIVVADCAFSANKATAGGGVRFEAFSGGEVLLLRCTFDSNEATNGGGVDFGGPFLGIGPLLVTIDECIFTGNQSTSGTGLSFHSEDASTIAVLDSSFRSNRGCAGAGIFVSSAGSEILVERCSFVDNRRHSGCGGGTGGGGVRTHGSNLEIRQSTFVDNTFGHVWGEQGADMVIRRSTLLDNVSDRGLWLQSGSTCGLSDVILWGSQPQIGGASAANVVASFSDVHTNGTPLPGGGNLDLDPRLVSPASGDLHLSSSSPCIDAGSPGPVPLDSDFENDSRALDGNLDGRVRLDMGADEFGPAHLEIQGVAAAGSTLTFVTTGAPGLNAFLGLSTPGRFDLPRFGTLFLDPASPRARLVNFGTTPSSISWLVPSGIPSGVFHFQEICFGGGARVLSNYVPLQF